MKQQKWKKLNKSDDLSHNYVNLKCRIIGYDIEACWVTYSNSREKPIASCAAIGAISGAAITLVAIGYIDVFHPEHSKEIRKLIDYQAPDGLAGMAIIPLIYASAAAGSGAIVGSLKHYFRRYFKTDTSTNV